MESRPQVNGGLAVGELNVTVDIPIVLCWAKKIKLETNNVLFLSLYLTTTLEKYDSFGYDDSR